jgi:hypothetical protein
VVVRFVHTPGWPIKGHGSVSIPRRVHYHALSDSIHSSTPTCPSPARYLQVIRPFVERGSNGLPFAHNKSHGSRRYRAAHGDIAGRCERSDGGGEGQHRKQCTRSPRTGERERCVAKAQRTAPSSIRSRCLHTVRRCGPEKRSRLGRLGNNSLSTIGSDSSGQEPVQQIRKDLEITSGCPTTQE